MWATVGEIVMPGHPFDALGKSTNKSKPPRAKETMSVSRAYGTPPALTTLLQGVSPGTLHAQAHARLTISVQLFFPLRRRPVRPRDSHRPANTHRPHAARAARCAWTRTHPSRPQGHTRGEGRCDRRGGRRSNGRQRGHEASVRLCGEAVAEDRARGG